MADRQFRNNGDLLSRQGLVVMELARRFLKHQPEDRIMSVVEHSQALDASVGTIQSAINYLQDQGAIELEARGRLGTYIRTINYPQLWTLAYNRPLIGALPLPDFIWLAGLATGIRAAFDHQPIDIDLRYIRGATTRLQALSSHKCDWTIVSGFVAESAGLQGFEIEPIMAFGLNTYTVNLVMLFGTPGVEAIEDGMRIGIDNSSMDHTYMVHSVCRDKQVEYVNIDFSQGIKLLRLGEIDATCWQANDVPEGLSDVTVIPIENETDVNITKLSEATVVTLPGHTHVASLLQAVLDVEIIRGIQMDVVNRAQLPSY